MAEPVFSRIFELLSTSRELAGIGVPVAHGGRHYPWGNEYADAHQAIWGAAHANE